MQAWVCCIGVFSVLGSGDVDTGETVEGAPR